MPRTVRKVPEPSRIPRPDLADRLAVELGRTSGGGQPRVEEEVFPTTNLIRVVVLWDDWEGVSDEDRVVVVQVAYTSVEGAAYAERLAHIVALTFPEAQDSGMLPYRVVPLVRRGDPVTLAQCETAMIAEGASTLRRPPFLAFATREEALACEARLAAAFPETAAVWAILTEPYRPPDDPD